MEFGFRVAGSSFLLTKLTLFCGPDLEEIQGESEERTAQKTINFNPASVDYKSLMLGIIVV